MTTLFVFTPEEDTLWNKVLSSLMVVQDLEPTLVASHVTGMQELISIIDKNSVGTILVRASNPLAYENSIAHILTTYPKLQVIVANENSNYLHIFKKEEVLLTRFADLLDLLTSG